MITSHTYDIATGRAREAAVMLHIGRMTVKGAAIDERTTVVLARLLAPAEPSVAVATLEKEMFGIKQRFLERAMPADWADRPRLLRAMQRVEEYRNTLAHSTVHIFYGISEPSERTRLNSIKGGWKDFNLDEFARWEACGDVTYAALFELSRSADANPRHYQVRELIFRHFGDPLRPEIKSAVDELFPTL